MSQNDKSRVLIRMGARELNHRECEKVNGSLIRTGVCTVINNPDGSCTMDGDCPVPLGC